MNKRTKQWNVQIPYTLWDVQVVNADTEQQAKAKAIDQSLYHPDLNLMAGDFFQAEIDQSKQFKFEFQDVVDTED